MRGHSVQLLPSDFGLLFSKWLAKNLKFVLLVDCDKGLMPVLSLQGEDKVGVDVE